MSNAWTRYYESIISPKQKKREAIERSPRVVQNEKQAPIVLRGAEKQIAEDNAQFRRYNRAKAAAYRTALEGPSGDFIKQLHNTLKKIDLKQADPLILLVHSMSTIDQESRYVALSMIDDAIVRLREQNGLAPFDDSLFDEEPTVFQICKSILGVV